jgi:hypothetical protein
VAGFRGDRGLTERAKTQPTGDSINHKSISEGAARRLERVQKSQFVAACWTAQIYLRIGNPKPSYVAPWEALPPWQQEVDADVFEAIEGFEGSS